MTNGGAGLTRDEAARRLLAVGRNAVRPPGGGRRRLLLRQLSDPLVLVLVVAAAIAVLAQETVDAAVIVAVVLGSAALGFVRESRAETAMARLRQRLVSRSLVLRDGEPCELPSEEIVPGDVVLLSAGTLVPADGVLREAVDLFVDEASLSGESFPVAKTAAAPGIGGAVGDAPESTCFQGTNVRSGFGRLEVAATGSATRLGHVARQLARPPRETGFERDIRHFGYLLTRLMTGIVVVVFAVNVLASKPPLGSLLFALAIAVGMSPELMPAIIAINLARGARELAAHGVLVRRLDAIESLGGMSVLCTDKTGTLTIGRVGLEAAVDPRGEVSPRVLRAAFLNAAFESGLPNPLDEALRRAGEAAGLDTRGLDKGGEVPYDFTRKRMSVAVAEAGRLRLISKGACHGVLAVCARVSEGESVTVLDDEGRRRLDGLVAGWSERGLRVLALAERLLDPGEEVSQRAESDLSLIGFLLFADPPKTDAAAAVASLAAAGVRIKMLTGDDRRVACHVAATLGLDARSPLVGADLDRLRDEALAVRVAGTDVFAELDPMHKERVIRALGRAGHSVGFLGDGINDAPALHAADVGISVDGAVDVAREAADLVLLAPDLGAVARGVEEGRRTLANTLKYVHVTSSANFGNMISLALASGVLPFLPLLAKQILLNNFLSDLPALALASDRVDPGVLARPVRWSMREIRTVMLTFGLVSSLFDLVVFALLLFVLGATPDLFRSGWFVASLLTELAALFVLRTRRPLHRSRPAPLLVVSSLLVAALAVALPFTPLAPSFGLVPLPGKLLAMVAAVTVFYAAASELAKRRFEASRGEPRNGGGSPRGRGTPSVTTPADPSPGAG